MTANIAQAADMRTSFDQIEEAYEFMLAYAAQGRKREVEEGGGESQIRQYVKRFHAALTDLDVALADGFGPEEGSAFADRFRDDISVVRSVLALLMSRQSITSDMIDNTNSLIALRALLTDLFFADQALLPPR